MTTFRQAAEMGADGVELDVHFCKYGKAGVIHNPGVDETTNGSGCAGVCPKF